MTSAPERAARADSSSMVARLNCLSPLRLSNWAVAILRSFGMLLLARSIEGPARGRTTCQCRDDQREKARDAYPSKPVAEARVQGSHTLSRHVRNHCRPGGPEVIDSR